MKPISLGLVAACALSLTGCSKSADKGELEALQAQTKALEARIDKLEGRLQAIEASLPDGDVPGTQAPPSGANSSGY